MIYNHNMKYKIVINWCMDDIVKAPTIYDDNRLHYNGVVMWIWSPYVCCYVDSMEVYLIDIHKIASQRP